MFKHKFNIQIEFFLISIGPFKIQTSKDKVEAKDGKNKLVFSITILSKNLDVNV